MKKKIIITTAIAACLALCAAVWPQSKTVEETPLPSAPVVFAPEATVEELKPEVETALRTEKEKDDLPQPEQTQEVTPEPEPVSAETLTVPEVQPTPEPASGQVSCGPAPEQAIQPPAAQIPVEPPSGDMVYVPGFGWIENQGPNHAEYAEDMYENGNKIGIMG